MDNNTIINRFYALISPSQPNEWEIEEMIDSLTSLSDKDCQALLDHIPAIWPISHSLCYGYLKYGAEQVHVLDSPLLSEWVHQLLFHYEKGGLRNAESFMSDEKGNFLKDQHSSSRVTFSEISISMEHYIRGVSNSNIKLAEGKMVWTDTETIFLPKHIDIFVNKTENKLFFKLLATFQWSLIHLGVFKLLNLPDEVEDVANSTEKHILDTLITKNDMSLELLKLYFLPKVCAYICTHLPGLWKRSSPLFLPDIKVLCDSNSHKSNEYIKKHLISICDENVETKSHFSGVSSIPIELTIKECINFLQDNTQTQLEDISPGLRLILGELRIEKANAIIQEQRRAHKKDFVQLLARILPKKEPPPQQEQEKNGAQPLVNPEADQTIATISEALNETRSTKNTTIQIDNEHVTISEELIQLAKAISSDLGVVPIGYIQAASGLAGEGRLKNDSVENIDTKESVATGGHIYDEWDCRRNGYRKEWCTVIEEELPITKSNFITKTLQKHYGLRKRLRTQFEMMQTSHKVIRRQRDGDDLDLDAIIDAIGDRSAGQPSSDRLFVRLQREERSISTLFLIDMSNSTSGWIGTFIKESLVLLCEAMEKLGDQYGIYGFSGMRRSRCKLYHVKHIDEHYNEETQDRISAIGPKDYTRMAPAIRHLTSLLEKSESKTRLLISLSDGKPEDYDGYNGEYAIEDTRKALLEARGKGIVPFCITVDKQAHDYLDHMYGLGNYIFINRIEKLPANMAQIYRTLTR